MTTPETDEPQIITPQEARAILDAAIHERLGEDWDDEQTGWTLVSGNDYMARLSRGKQAIDFYVDLLGELRVEEKDGLPGFESGRSIAWMVLGASLFIALVIARIAGFL